MGIFDFFKKKVQLEKAIHSKDTSNSKPKSYNKDRQLDSMGVYADFNRPRDDKLFELSVKAAKAQSIDEEIKLLSKFIEYYYQYKNESTSLGGFYYKNFCDMHMHCHNSRNPDFEFVVPKEERLKYIQDNYESLIKAEQEKISNEKKKQSMLKNINLEKSLKENIINNPGILQSDLYKQYDSLLKDDISEKLYYWSKEGKITREKCGRTYQLFWKK